METIHLTTNNDRQTQTTTAHYGSRSHIPHIICEIFQQNSDKHPKTIIKDDGYIIKPN